MPNVTLVFFLLLIPLSGFIAWAGDRIGHKSGKRRHSIFGLRPRHTAMVFTIGSGILTTLVSFGAFYLFSADFRNVVEHGQEMIEKTHDLENQNKVQAAELAKSQKQVQTVRGELGDIEAQRQSVEAVRDQALRNLEAVRDKRAQAEALALAAQNNYLKAQNGLVQAQSKLTQAQNNLNHVRTELSRKTTLVSKADASRVQAEANLRKAKSEVIAAQANVSKAHGEQQSAQKEAREAKAFYAKTVQMNRTLLSQTNDLIAQKNGLQELLDKQKSQVEDLNKRTDEMRGQVASLQGEKARTEGEIRNLRQNATALRGGQITYQVGEEVDRLTIPAGYNVWRVKAILYSFLSSASKKAETRGAGRNATDRSVVILPRAYTGGATTVSDQGNPPRDVKFYTEENAIGDAAELIRRANEDTVVVVNAATNAVAGETVPVNVHVFHNRIVIKADTKLGEISINGDGPRQEIADRLLLFLNRDIHSKLIEGGIIPHLRSEDVTGADTTRVAEQFSLGGEEWLSLIDSVRNAGPKAKIAVYPAHDLRAADTPQLRFDVRHPLLQAPAFLRDVK